MDETAAESGRVRLRSALRSFSHDDIYNMDQTSLFFKLGSPGILSTRPVPGKKKSKERITIALICNASGTDKRKPIIVSKFMRDRCFGKIFDPSVYCDSFHNRKAWMTTAIFQTVITKLDQDLRLQGRSAVLVLDNATCHNTAGLEVTSLELCFLLKNTTSHLQPLDEGIIRRHVAEI